MSKTPKVVHYKKDFLGHDTFPNEKAVYVGRPTKWGNPFQMIKESDRADVIKKYREYIMARPEMIKEAKRELRGRDLACWCAPRACHADVLLEIANS